MLFSRGYAGIAVCLFHLAFISLPSQKLLSFSDIFQNGKTAFSDIKSCPDCLAIGNAEKVDLFRYIITRMREMNYSKWGLYRVLNSYDHLNS